MLTYEKYNDEKLAVRGNKDTYHAEINKLGGRWNSRMKGGPGWFLPVDKENDLKKFIRKLKREAKNSVKNEVLKNPEETTNNDDNKLLDFFKQINTENNLEPEPTVEIEKIIEELENPESKAEIEELVADVDEPNAELEEPVEEPNAELEELNVEVEEPNAEVEETNVEVEEPNAEVEEPNAEVEEPNAEVEEPNGEVEEPVEEPNAEVEEPVEECVAEVEEPVEECVAEVEEAVVEPEEPKVEMKEFEQDNNNMSQDDGRNSEDYESDESSVTKSAEFNTYDKEDFKNSELEYSTDDSIMNQVKDIKTVLSDADIDSDDDSAIVDNFLNNLLGDLSDEEEYNKKFKKSKERFRRITKSRELRRQKKQETEEKIKFKKQILNADKGIDKISGENTFDFYRNLAVRNNSQYVVSDSSDSEYSESSDDYPSPSTVKQKTREEQIADLETEITQLRLENEKLSTQLKTIIQKY